MDKNSNTFFEVMSRHSDKKLLEIVEDKRDEYNSEALEAAEFVLRSRNISWKVLKKTGEEEQVTYFEDVQSEIDYRLAQGENIEDIRRSLKLRGINIFEYADMEKKEAEKNNPEFAALRKKLGLRIGAVIMMLYGLRPYHDAFLMAMITFAIALILFIASFFVGKPGNE